MTNDKNERPVFLLVLCILSWVGLGFTILSNLVNLALSPFRDELTDLSQQNMDEAMREISTESEAMGSFFSKIFGSTQNLLEHQTELTIVSLICSVIAIIGVTYMFKLRKIGFYFFTVAKVFAVAYPIILLSSNILAMISTLVTAFFVLAFIIMYAVNLKAMK